MNECARHFGSSVLIGGKNAFAGCRPCSHPQEFSGGGSRFCHAQVKQPCAPACRWIVPLRRAVSGLWPMSYSQNQPLWSTVPLLAFRVNTPADFQATRLDAGYTCKAAADAAGEAASEAKATPQQAADAASNWARASALE